MLNDHPLPLVPAKPVPHPLFRDPVFDGAADPTVVWNRARREWWMFYTNRRAWSPALDDYSWFHGTDIGIAVSNDGGVDWTYRGIATGLETDSGRHTYWAPEIFDDGTKYHMYVSFIVGSPSVWAGHPRSIRHYVSDDLQDWVFESTLDLESEGVIDACVVALPGGGYRMWFKDELAGSGTFVADSADLHHWSRTGGAVESFRHEGPNVFQLGEYWWMIVDEWVGQRVLRSDDLLSWHPQGRILDGSGTGTDDQGFGFHADVVVAGDEAFVFYFTHPGRAPGEPERNDQYQYRRSSIHVARVTVRDGALVCDRDAALTGPYLTVGTELEAARA